MTAVSNFSETKIYIVDCGGSAPGIPGCGRYRVEAARRPTYCPRCLERDGLRWVGYKVSIKELKAAVSEHICTEACRTSKESKCRCSCGGANHGMDATSRWAILGIKD